MSQKVVLIILDGMGWKTARTLLGNVEGWVEKGDASVWKMRATLPSVSGPCYASIHTGVTPQQHGIVDNYKLQRVETPDIFSEARRAGRTTAAAAHSFFSSYFQRAPFDIFRDLEVDDESLPIQHARFYTMTGETKGNMAVPSEADLFAQSAIMIDRHQPDYLLIHSSTVDSTGHRYGPDSAEMDHVVYVVDGVIGNIIPRWLDQGYEIMITADHGQSVRGHHGGTTDEMREVAFYYFGAGTGPESGVVLDQLQIAPTVLSRLGVEPAETMKRESFLS
ncbi:alkaline phosphatase family protein [Pelagibius sp. Alg239-R121]|uniref:alkaline phosphatase family protein n=1 Tax=Pelagibius sp. Alg239-R121 TaxID=2993448 RepID=UPI002AC3593C|nr:alkaline phosphatase family protein [Pelagibius sp. Alg239-R121]